MGTNKLSEPEFSPHMKTISNIIQNRLLDLSLGVGGADISAAKCTFWADNITSALCKLYTPVALAPEMAELLQSISDALNAGPIDKQSQPFGDRTTYAKSIRALLAKIGE